MKVCKKCNTTLVLHDNWTIALKKSRNYICKRCRNKRAKKWRFDNKESVKNTRRQYYIRNKNEELIRSRNWRINNPEKIKMIKRREYINNTDYIKQKVKKWRKDNPYKKNAINAKRRSTKLFATPNWLTKFDCDYITHLYNQAAELSKLTGEQHDVHHIAPLQSNKFVCGLHVPWNLEVLSKTKHVELHRRS